MWIYFQLPLFNYQCSWKLKERIIINSFGSIQQHWGCKSINLQFMTLNSIRNNTMLESFYIFTRLNIRNELLTTSRAAILLRMRHSFSLTLDTIAVLCLVYLNFCTNQFKSEVYSQLFTVSYYFYYYFLTADIWIK